MSEISHTVDEWVEYTAVAIPAPNVVAQLDTGVDSGK
jgi:hypothetical protein